MGAPKAARSTLSQRFPSSCLLTSNQRNLLFNENRPMQFQETDPEMWWDVSYLQGVDPVRLLGEEGVHLGGRLFLQRGSDVGVSVKGLPHGRVAEEFLHDLGMDILLEQQCRGRMT